MKKKYSLSSGTPNTLIYTNSNSYTVILKSTQTIPQSQTDSAILRLLGPEILQMGNQEALAKSLSGGTLQGASDGSMKFGQGTCAWRVEPKTSVGLSDHSLTRATPVDGDPDTMNSTRAERGGFIDPLYYVEKLASKYKITQGKLTMYVDKISSFTNCDPPRPWEGPLRHLTDDYDLKQLKAVCDIALDKHKILVTWCHVKGHQDETRNRKKTPMANISLFPKQHC